MNKKELQRKYDLVTNHVWKEIREIALDKIIRHSRGTEPLIMQGMLNLIDDIDNWKTEFEKELERDRKKD